MNLVEDIANRSERLSNVLRANRLKRCSLIESKRSVAMCLSLHSLQIEAFSWARLTNSDTDFLILTSTNPGRV